MSDTLTWLHFSDLHTRGDRIDDLRLVLASLWRDIEEQKKQISDAGGKLDFIVFSGDIAFSGKTEQYELAKDEFFTPLLTKTCLSLNALFIVPGNHDINRAAVELLQTKFAKTLRSTQDTESRAKTRTQVQTLLSDPDRCRTFFSPLANYGKFIGALYGSSAGLRSEPPYSYATLLPLQSPRIALCGLNSTWYSSHTRVNREISDKGNLLIGAKQVTDALMAARDAEIIIGAVHHPMEYLQDFDRDDVQKRLHNGRALILLHGHLHQPDFRLISDPGGETVVIPAGAAYENSEYLNSYSVGQINFRTGDISVSFRRYSPQRDVWVSDSQSTATEDGVWKIPFPTFLQKFRLAESVTPDRQRKDEVFPVVDKVLNEARPIWSRLGRQANAQFLQGFIDKRAEQYLLIWGEKGCGLAEFMNVALQLLNQMDIEQVYFDGDAGNRGKVFDEQYFMKRVERWIGIKDGQLAGEKEHIKDRWTVLRDVIQDRPTPSNAQLALVFGNFHLLPANLARWVYLDFCPKALVTLRQYNPVAIFAGEGTTPDSLRGSNGAHIELEGFTVEDVTDFLRSLPSMPSLQIPALARRLHGDASENLSVQEVRKTTNNLRPKLHQNLGEHFSEEDLRTLCFYMEVDYENLPAQGKAGKARELITYVERNGRTAELIEHCRKQRPGISWEDTPETSRSTVITPRVVASEQLSEDYRAVPTDVYKAIENYLQGALR